MVVQQGDAAKFSPTVWRSAWRSNAGTSLLAAMALLAFISSLILAYLATAVDSSHWTDTRAISRRLETAAHSLLALSIDNVWGEFRRAHPNGSTHFDFRLYMENRGILNQAGQANPTSTDLRALFDTNQVTESADFQGLVVEHLQVRREDLPRSIRLYFEVEVSHGTQGDGPGGVRRTVQEVLSVEPPSWGGLDFALLANNINCVMCHTEVDNAFRFYNTDEEKFGTFERTKLGSLESFQLRDDPMSWIAGTLYLQGDGVHDDGSEITDWSAMGLKSRSFDGHGMLSEDAWGDLVETDLAPADNADLGPYENLYVSYSDESGDQIDGFLPDSFPAPFPDDGGYDKDTGLPVTTGAGNRQVDEGEFYVAAQESSGVVTGGVIGVLPEGGTVSTEAELASFQSGGETKLNAVTEGNVYLYGTEDNPIVLDGNLAIDGDLILMGVVKGEGVLRVSGNIYMPSDVTYADGDAGGAGRTFGSSEDGTSNILALAAGGNIMVGDVFHPAWGDGTTTGDTDGSFSFIMEELALFNRMEWMKTQPTLPGKSVYTEIGEEIRQVERWNWESYEVDVEVTTPIRETYWVDESVPIYETVNNGRSGEYYRQWSEIVGYETQSVQKKRTIGYTTETVTRTKWRKVGDSWMEDEVKKLYEWQTPNHANPHYEGEEYMPRYYGFTGGSTIPIFNEDGYLEPNSGAWIADERAGSWWDSGMSRADPDDPNDPFLFDAEGNPKAVISTLTPTGNWLSEDMLRKLITTALEARDPDQPLEINGTLYSNNSIFGIIPASGGTGVSGELLVNGGIVASDVGLLAPTRLQLNHDTRSRRVLDIRSDTQIELRRVASLPVGRVKLD